jgi:hypothetical protein
MEIESRLAFHLPCRQSAPARVIFIVNAGMPAFLMDVFLGWGVITLIASFPVSAPVGAIVNRAGSLLVDCCILKRYPSLTLATPNADADERRRQLSARSAG